MHYLNQLEYPHIPYPTHVSTPQPKNTTVASSGCGICTVCMMVDLLTDKALEIEECVRISQENIANHKSGTDMSILAPVISEKFGLDYKSTRDKKEVISEIMRGAVVVAHVGVPEEKERGLFTLGGHYVLIVSTDGERFCILDPSYKTNKFTGEDRFGLVDDSHAPYLYCNTDVFDGEIKPGKIGYHIFSRKTN